MDRKEFLQLMGAGSAGLVIASCLGGCKKENNTPSKLSRDFTLDLTASGNSALTHNGGYMVVQQVVVARTQSGSFIAVAAACTHAGTNVQFRSSSTDFRCPNHGATFNASGGVTSGPASSDLQQFKTQLSGNSLRVYS
ncbi:MAG TPA: Rieske (2Fe-2S) protein [Flavobacteriales bacterium]|nr:Rieske (2Fe-2S) protein [Flavobacteriales bacterium]